MFSMVTYPQKTRRLRAYAVTSVGYPTGLCRYMLSCMQSNTQHMQTELGPIIVELWDVR